MGREERKRAERERRVGEEDTPERPEPRERRVVWVGIRGETE